MYNIFLQCWFQSETTQWSPSESLTCLYSGVIPQSLLLSLVILLSWVVPEVKAETEMETQGDLWEAILSSMIRRCGSGTRKGRKPIWVCYQASKPCGQPRLPFQYGALGDHVERCPRVILFRTYESGNSSHNPYPLLASGHSRGDSFSSTSSMPPGEFQMQALEGWVPRACCRGSGMDSICCNYTDSFEEDGPVL